MIVFYHAKWNLAKVRMNLMRSNGIKIRGRSKGAISFCFMLLVAISAKFRYKVFLLYCPKPVCDWFTWWWTKTSRATISSNQKLEQLTRLVRMRFPVFGGMCKLDSGKQMPWLWEGRGNFKTVIRGVRCEGISVCFQGKPKYLSIFVRLRSCSVCWLFYFSLQQICFCRKKSKRC